MKIEKLDWWEMTMDDGSRYVRFGPNDWGLWMGESLEIEQFIDECLERIFQAELTAAKSGNNLGQ